MIPIIILGLPVLPIAILMWPIHKWLYGTEPTVREYVVICASTSLFMLMMFLPMWCCK
jgi:hypothetical protein